MATNTAPASAHRIRIGLAMAADLMARQDAGWPTSAAIIQTAAAFDCDTDRVRRMIELASTAAQIALADRA